MAKTLVIFDIDGTLTNTNTVDYKAYSDTFHGLYDVKLPETLADDCIHYTDTGVAQYVFERYVGRPVGPVDLRKIKSSMVDHLMKYMDEDEKAFEEVKGANAFIEFLQKQSDIVIAIATGCWEETATLKLNIAGIEYENIPLSHSGISEDRSGIIAHAIEQSKKQYGVTAFDKVVYIGDGIWDVKTTQAMQIPLVGIDCNATGKLKNAGVKEVFADYSNPSAILKSIQAI